MNNEELQQLIEEKGCLSAEENTEIYEKYFKDWYAMHKPLYDEFGLKPTDTMLDIGCSYGSNLVHFNKASVGIDINEKIISFNESIGINMIKTNIEENLGVPEGKKFDVIWVSDFLPHLASPYPFLLKVREVMNEETKLIIQISQYTPLIPQNIKRTYYSPCHYYAFNYPTLKYLLEAAGFQVVHSSGYLRHLPMVINRFFNPLLKRYGSNLWIVAKKKDLVCCEKQPIPSGVLELKEEIVMV